MKPSKALLIILMLGLCSFAKPDTTNTSLLEQKLENMRISSADKLRDSVVFFYDLLRYENDFEYRMQLANEAFEITQVKDEKAHIHSLIFKANHSKDSAEYYFSLAWNIALKNQHIDDMNAVEYNRSLYFIDHKQYDSAMIHILIYRELSEGQVDGEGARNILNLLGDVYYHCGLFDQASEVYSEILYDYEKEQNWNYFRPYVMMNNLGQIALQSNEYATAYEWFNKSLLKARDCLKTDYRNNTMAYIYIKLAETELSFNHIEKADSLLMKVDEFPHETVYNDVTQEYLLVRLKLLVAQKNWTKALEYALQLLPADTSIKPHKDLSEIYHQLSDIYKNLGNEELSLLYLRKYVGAQDLFNEAEHSARSMVLLAKKNMAKTQLSLKQAHQRNMYLFFGLSVVIVLLVTLIVLYIRLYKSQLHLVKKAMDETKVNKSSESRDIETKENEEGDLENLNELIEKLTKLIQEEKVYLQADLTIAELSKKLNTNRTYLSKALNNRLKTSFPNYINQLRIQEAIRLIDSGYQISHTQEALSEKCGFSSRSAFIRSFKKHTGVVPSFFIANFNKIVEE